MAGSSLKLNRDLMTRVKKCAAAGGYSTPEEFIEHILEREIAKLEDADSDEEIARRLKGLGYLD